MVQATYNVQIQQDYVFVKVVIPVPLLVTPSCAADFFFFFLIVKVSPRKNTVKTRSYRCDIIARVLGAPCFSSAARARAHTWFFGAPLALAKNFPSGARARAH